MGQDQWIGVSKAAQLLRRHPGTVRRMVERGELAGVVRPNGRYSVSLASVEAQVGRGRNPQVAAAVDQAIAEALDSLAEQRNLRRADLVREALEEYLERRDLAAAS